MSNSSGIIRVVISSSSSSTSSTSSSSSGSVFILSVLTLQLTICIAVIASTFCPVNLFALNTVCLSQSVQYIFTSINNTTTYPSIGSNAIERGISSSSSIKTLPILPSKLVNSMVPLGRDSEQQQAAGSRQQAVAFNFQLNVKNTYLCSSSPPGQSASPSHNQSKLMHVMRSLHWNSRRKQGLIDCVRFKQPWYCKEGCDNERDNIKTELPINRLNYACGSRMPSFMYILPSVKYTRTCLIFDMLTPLLTSHSSYARML
uniref:Uncharacterized protein n=1 Tax=Glossina austeni TaxID=7395 RepID=A0A1A9VH17_GLOAU